ncbi:uncharacterized protein LOC141632703 [Silene latifolia]|uniref:uncharacterized protein LOC141632703 n=1 Tax=Silene latifolia TaxID=37657 RepID=UPI003D785B54
MDFIVRDERGEWRVTGFYGWPAVTNRHLSWRLLQILRQQSKVPWVCLGDFNEVLFLNEMKGGTRAQWQMNNFQEAVDECGLSDVKFEGYAFTWDNGQAGEANRQSRIDRAMATCEWKEKFPYARLIHLGREWSDHSLIKLLLDRRGGTCEVVRKFRFEQIWVGKDGCETAVQRGFDRWGEDLMEALGECASELQKWKKVSIGKIVKAISVKKNQLARLNEGGRSVEEVRRRRKIVSEIVALCRQEEHFWRQRSRALWLKEGDRNTSYFHRQDGQRKAKNYISKLVDDESIVRTEEEAVSRVATRYFTNLFEASPSRDFGDIFDGMEGRVLEWMNAILGSEYREEEVSDALNQIHLLKAPGPDEMNGLFYQTYWHIVGPMVIRTVFGVLRGDQMPEGMNHTHIMLIPKKKAPDKIRDFRPISLCNVVYKLVSKVLANRLKPFLNDIVSENQSAFTPGRLISDNVLIAFELFHHMKNSRHGEGFMAIKLDMAKAYDRVEWDFLEAVLRGMGFYRGWVDRVMMCVSSISSVVLINGNAKEVFRAERGLRQGDPLSPYLFILCAEVLSNQMRRAVMSNSLHGIRIAPNASTISHLLFADDSIFFLKASEEEAGRVCTILRRYEEASGQSVNLEKTMVSFSRSVKEGSRNNIAGCLGVEIVEEQERYLGLPTVVGRSKKPISNIIRDKLNKRLQGWRGKTLSRAGREVLIKAVANSLPTYVMSIFKLPANFCDELRSIVSRFWWGHEECKRRISWVAWKRLCRPKDMGGLGFRDFFKMNQALLGKQACRLLTSQNCLWARLMQSKYYYGKSFLDAELGDNPSYTWRGIIGAREVLLKGLRRRIGDGCDTFVWRDAWIPATQTGKVVSPCVRGNAMMRVAKLMTDDGRAWNEQQLNTVLMSFEQERVRNIRLSNTPQADSWYWSCERDGNYSVKSAYRLLDGIDLSLKKTSNWAREKWIWNKLWKTRVWPRIKLFFWQFCNNALATKVNVSIRVNSEDVMCPLCHCQVESIIYLFRDCMVAGQFWEGLNMELEDGGGGVGQHGEVRERVEGWWREMEEADYERMMVACWALWEARNRVVFEGGSVEVKRVIKRVRDVVEEINSGYEESKKEVEEGDNRRGREVDEGWRAPSPGWVKLNVDVGVKEGIGVGVGAVCRDEMGRVLWGLARHKKEVWEPRVAEAVAVLDRMEEAVKAGHENLVVESDCSHLIEAIKAHKTGRSPFFLVLNDIRTLCSLFSSISWSYTSRNNNKVAHALAHVLPSVVGNSVWIGTLPEAVNRFLD